MINDNLYAGVYIKSTSALIDSFFENTTILIVEDNEKGSTGFVINRPFEKSLNDLIEFNHCNAFPLMDGGPVDRDHLYILHKRPDLIDGGKPVSNGFYLGGNMDQVIKATNTNAANQIEIQIFIGYCGWDPGELKAEIAEGSWIVVD